MFSKLKPKILITGAAGRVGLALSKGLASQYALTRLDIHPMTEIANTRVIQADMCDEYLIKELCAEHDIIIHLAISGNINDDIDAMIDVNLQGTRTLFEAVRSSGGQRIIFASTINALIRPTLPYSASKLWAEKLAARYTSLNDLSIICLRLGAVLPNDWRYYELGHPEAGHILTHNDLINLFQAAIQASPSLKFGVFYGLSASAKPTVGLSETTKALGYIAQDNSDELAKKNYKSLRGIFRRIKKGIIKYVRKD